MPLEINAQFRKFVEFAEQRANPATSSKVDAFFLLETALNRQPL